LSNRVAGKDHSGQGQGGGGLESLSIKRMFELPEGSQDGGGGEEEEDSRSYGTRSAPGGTTRVKNLFVRKKSRNSKKARAFPGGGKKSCPEKSDSFGFLKSRKRWGESGRGVLRKGIGRAKNRWAKPGWALGGRSVPPKISRARIKRRASKASGHLPSKEKALKDPTQRTSGPKDWQADYKKGVQKGPVGAVRT